MMRFAAALGAVFIFPSMPAPAADAPARAGVVRLPMKLRYGVPSIPCKVNGREVWMIVDTGSTACLLAAETAARVGVRPMRGAERAAQVMGSHGTESAGVASVARLSAGDWSWTGVPMLIRQRRAERYDTGIFAPPVLIDVLSVRLLKSACSYLTIDSTAGQVEFGFAKPFQARREAHSSIPLRFIAGLPCLDVAINQVRLECLVDTGTSAQMEIHAGSAGAAGVRADSTTAPKLRIGVGRGNPQAARVHSAIVPQARLGGATLRNLECVLVPDASKLGFGTLRRFRTTFDFARNRLWLE